MIVLVDNYDSFVENLARYFRRLGHETRCLRNDILTAGQIVEMKPDAIVLSPGPCTPQEAGCSLELVRRAAGKIPMLGVCLGHQTIAAAFGACIVRAPIPVHGRASLMTHDGQALFSGLANPLHVGRYHSLVVEESSLPVELTITARTLDGVVMGLVHRHWPIFGVQFHPESILTDEGYPMLHNFLRLAGLETTIKLPNIDDERPPLPAPTALPAGPVTF